jgi:cellulose 1,4-beta-cellobiosidase
VVVLAQCGGPEKLTRHLNTTGAGGQAGAAIPTGMAGIGAAGTGDAGTGVVGTGAAGATVTGAAGTGAAGTGAAGTGAAGTGAAGTGTAGTGAAGTGAAGTGTAGTGAAGRGAAGTGAAGTGMVVDAGTDAPPNCNCKLKVQYECRQNGASVLQPEYSLRVVNTGTTAIQLNTVTVRYWYTVDGTGTQTGSCASTAHPCTIAFQPAPMPKATADTYAVISFGGGSLAAGADTGEIQIQMRGSGAMNQTNDFSFLNTGAVYTDQPDITGYVSGKLIWGAPP